jgi:hypothetical protein
VSSLLVVGLSGGLGNQLFQYASGFGIATQRGADLRFDDTFVEADERWLPGLLGPHYVPASRLDLLRVGELPRHGSDPRRTVEKAAGELLRLAVDAGRRVRRRTPRVLPTEAITHEVGRFDPSLFTIDLPIMLRGWFQTERYFESVADEVAARLQLPAVPATPALTGDRPVVAVHFRRGDYVRYGWELPLAYYERALEQLTGEVPGAAFLVFGDDPLFVHFATEWVTRFGPATDAYDITDGALEHLVLASRCDHTIIANSTFAWWAAWLGERRRAQRLDQPRGLVLAPTLYAEQMGADVVPNRWRLVTTD